MRDWNLLIAQALEYAPQSKGERNRESFLYVQSSAIAPIPSFCWRQHANWSFPGLQTDIWRSGFRTNLQKIGGTEFANYPKADLGKSAPTQVHL